MSVSPDAFRWIKGEDALRDYESSPGKIRRFCSRCGSPMTAERPGNPAAAVRVRLGTLDTRVENPRYFGHIWRCEAADRYLMIVRHRLIDDLQLSFATKSANSRQVNRSISLAHR
jgi:hypothetical protein